MSVTDVVLAGDGIAGCAAAISLSRLGLNAALIRQSTATRVVDLPETLPPTAPALLRELGIDAETIERAFPRITHRISRWGAGSVAHESMIPRASASLLLGKGHLRSLLWNLVLGSGIAIIDAKHIRQVHKEPGTIVVQVGLANEPSNIEISARFAIDATGRASSLAQKFGVRRRILDDLVSFWIVGSADGWPQDAIAAATVRDGWLFCAGSKTGRAAIGFFTAGSYVSGKPTAENILDRVSSIPDIADLLRSLSIWKRSSTVTRNAASTVLMASGGIDWIACGDALQTVDPIASSGISIALKQGILAATVAKTALAGDQRALRVYEAATRPELQEILARRSAYYGLNTKIMASAPP
jgi:2-polyprenyl-6-methoxyphenol hydroxylase-like FAD-dependent oxidoreductase